MDGQRLRVSDLPPYQTRTWQRAVRPSSMTAPASARADTASEALRNLRLSQRVSPALPPYASVNTRRPALNDMPAEIIDLIARQLPVYDMVSLGRVDRQTRANLVDLTESAHLLARASRALTSQEVREVLKAIRGMERCSLRGQPLAKLAWQLPALPQEDWLFAYLQIRHAASEVPANARGPVIQALAAQICRLSLNERFGEALRIVDEIERLPVPEAALALAQIPGNLMDVAPAQQVCAFNVVLQATKRLPPQMRSKPLMALVRQYSKLPNQNRWDALCALLCDLPAVAPADRAFMLERLANGLDHFKGAELSVAYHVLCGAILELPRHQRWRALSHLIRQVNWLPKNERLKQFVLLIEYSSALPIEACSSAFYELAVELSRLPSHKFRVAYVCLTQAVSILPPKLALMPMMVLMYHSTGLIPMVADDFLFQ